MNWIVSSLRDSTEILMEVCKMINELIFDDSLLSKPYCQSSDALSKMRDFDEDDFWDSWDLDADPFEMEDPWSEPYAHV